MTALAALLIRMQERLQTGHDETDSAFASIARRQHDVSALVEMLHGKLAAHRTERELAIAEDLRPRVLAACARGAFAALSPREARAGARMIGALEPRVLARLLQTRSEVAGAFTDELFRSWDFVATLPERAAYANIAHDLKGPLPGSRFAPAAILVSPEGPHAIASAAPRTSLGDAMRWLRAQGFPFRWGFTAHVCGFIVSWMSSTRGHEDVWKQLAEEPELAACVLPPRQRDNGRWFFSGSTGKPSGSTPARAMVVASLLYYLREANREAPDAFVDGLIDSDFGDPRVPPESVGWRLVRGHAPKEYDRFLENLIREDLVLFFDHAMSDRAREVFWLTYLKSIRRTVAVLSRSTYQTLKAQLQGSKGSLRAALGRVRQFSSSSDVNAFCLYFDQFVIVEFSQTGNAAYIYRRADFDREIEPMLARGRISSANDLKLKELCEDKINHHINWEAKAHYLLHYIGIRHS